MLFGTNLEPRTVVLSYKVSRAVRLISVLIRKVLTQLRAYLNTVLLLLAK